MALLNYTTQVDPSKSIAEIHRRLVKFGVRGVLYEYDGKGLPASLAFTATTAFGERSFRLPCRTDAVLATLTKQHRAGKIQPRFVTREQAARVAWRILKDSVEVQLAFAEVGLSTVDEVFFPWMLGPGGETAYEHAVSRHKALPSP